MEAGQGQTATPGAPRRYTKIILPTRAQPDTLVAIFLLRTFSEHRLPGARDAAVSVWQVMPAGETEDSLDRAGIILIDIGGGRFDHHGRSEKTTTADLVASYLGVKDDPALAKLLEYSRRDDFYGKGTISTDTVDRALGLSGLVAALNKEYVHDPAKVVEIITPLLEAHYREEVRRTRELPAEFAEKLQRNEAETFEIKQRGKKLKVVVVTSESASLSGYLRSQSGGRFDVVAQWLPSGHVNILTRPTKRVDLRALAVLLRLEEATHAGRELTLTPHQLAVPGRVTGIPEWYYDPATNSVQNGGLDPKDIAPTHIPRVDFRKIVELGLSEAVWSPSVGGRK